MYIPKINVETDLATLWAFMQQYSFALLCSQVDGRPFATHIPFLLDAERGSQGYLTGHLAKANPHWQKCEQEALVVFSGPHAYISPTWYDAANTVPTWNYLAVHVYGQFKLVDNRDHLRWIVEESVRVYEEMMPQPWQIDMSPERLDNMLNAIVGFEIEITEIQGKKKLNQNHSVERRENVIRALSNIETDDAQAIAREMIQTLPPSS
ncbi:MAG: FMN-binding negative transcriptional regulator [Chloroflexota bacterium]